MIRRRGLAPLLAAPVLLRALPVRAQGSWPDRPLRLVVPNPAGGGLDALARAIADHLSRAWGQPVVVDNRPGAASITGTDVVAKAAPDGNTLLMTSDAPITSNPHIHRLLPHDPMRDLTPVSLLVEVAMMVLAHPSLAARDMGGLVAAARARPGALNYGSWGPGSQPHLLFEALKAREAVDIAQVTYRGVSPAAIAVVAGEVQMTLSGVPSAQGFIRSGTLRPLAVSRDTRMEIMPEVPTLIEAGFGDTDPRTWFGLLAPAATPPARIAFIHAEVARAMADPAIRDRHLTPNGYTVHAATPERSRAMIEQDFAAKARLVRISGATVD